MIEITVRRSALNILDDAMVKMQGGAAHLQELSAVAGSNMLAEGPHHDAFLYLFVCFWIFVVIDSTDGRYIQDKSRTD